MVQMRMRGAFFCCRKEHVRAVFFQFLSKLLISWWIFSFLFSLLCKDDKMKFLIAKYSCVHKLLVFKRWKTVVFLFITLRLLWADQWRAAMTFCNGLFACLNSVYNHALLSLKIRWKHPAYEKAQPLLQLKTNWSFIVATYLCQNKIAFNGFYSFWIILGSSKIECWKQGNCQWF